MKVIWLTSWYPNPIRPFDGDFVQRHARAVSQFIPVTVFYVDQSGHRVPVYKSEVIKRREPNLVERIIFFKYKATGFDLLDKLWYNYLYFRTYKRAIRKYIKRKGKPDLIHIHIPMKAGVIGKWIEKTYNIPYIVSEQSAHYGMNSADDFFNKSPRHKNQAASIFKNAIAVTNVSSAVGETIKSTFNLDSVKTIRNTVDTNLFKSKPQINRLFRFIHVSTLNERQKNIQGILDAIEGLTRLRVDFEFIMVGPVTATLRKTITTRNLGKWVNLTGEIPYPDVAQEMRNSDSLILFSNYENFPCVVVEALCAGLTVISSDIGGVSEAVKPENGILVQPGNSEELTNAMFRMMNNYDSYDRTSISSNARQLYGYQIIGKEFVELYREILSSKK